MTGEQQEQHTTGAGINPGADPSDAANIAAAAGNAVAVGEPTEPETARVEIDNVDGLKLDDVRASTEAARAAMQPITLDEIMRPTVVELPGVGACRVVFDVDTIDRIEAQLQESTGVTLNKIQSMRPKVDAQGNVQPGENDRLLGLFSVGWQARFIAAACGVERSRIRLDVVTTTFRALIQPYFMAAMVSAGLLSVTEHEMREGGGEGNPSAATAGGAR